MHTYTGGQQSRAGLALVVAMHVLVVYALLTGLGKIALERVRPTVPASVVKDVPPPQPEIQPLKPKFSDAPHVVVPTQDIVIESPPLDPRPTMPPSTPGETFTDVPGSSTAAPGPGATTPVRKEFQPSYRTDPVYPRVAQRDGVTGVVVARLHVAPGGEVLRVEIVSSASRVLEREVVRALSQWRFKPEPVGFIAEYEIAFNLRD